MSGALFITGTDTDVGKTIVTAGILRYLCDHGIDAVSMKPVQTGAEQGDAGLVAPDLSVHHAAAGISVDSDERALMTPYLYEPACSPHLAGRMAGRYPDIAHIVDCASRLREGHDCLLVEGAGGIMAPLTESETMLDLMQALAAPVVLVAHRGLGTINHSLLSIEALKKAGLAITGLVFNETRDVERDFIKRDNPDTVRAFGDVDILGDVDFLPELETEPRAAWIRFDKCMPGLSEIMKALKT